MASVHYLADYPDYLPTVVAWLHREWDYLSPDRTIEDVYRQIQQHCQKEHLPATFIMLHDEQIIGTAGIHLYDMQNYMHIPYWLSAVYITPAYRGKGFGKQLTMEVTEEAFRLGADELYLATPDKCDWYERFGWQFLEPCRYSENLTVSIMKQCAPRSIIYPIP